jgi:membrane-bound lytic murein transglycosylase F
LLAAISYQESHWNPKAKSPTGVRGFMMLTRNTAKAMGVKNRLDPKASILGGARYLERLEKRVPSYIPYPDRKWMTLASYNVGFAHVRDARGVAAWQGENPNTWTGLREVLPLLSSKKIYKRLPHGYARGLEPVLYVSRIRNYHGVIKRELLRKGRL